MPRPWACRRKVVRIAGQKAGLRRRGDQVSVTDPVAIELGGLQQQMQILEQQMLVRPCATAARPCQDGSCERAPCRSCQTQDKPEEDQEER